MDDGSWSHAGDPIDVALLALSYKAKTTPGKLLEHIEKVSEVPFESERQYAAVYYREKGNILLE
jgi:magnesium-transporting ATPase (P-type)